ncbi:advanced glycosylation end product-specific receptor isoform X2 [Leptonychotes weddellii]|uniref:Advanced glycosylation end product-specific receptor isoform X2 n=1 Tax=Leptonychotes weddellii TaxID=9713 RepID=A0A7F8R1G5_LEPWE|nr:advanced glycosylation end product-specific receptor isoform X2 [Leptonychotes weddellii]
MAAAGAWVLVLSLWGAAVGNRNITARIGKPLVLNCRGAPKKPPQQLEWKLNTGRTEAWKVLSPQGSSWDSVARVLPNGSLLLPAVGIQDEGTFRCRATSRNGKETRSAYQVQVYRKSSRAFSMVHLSSKEKPSTPALDSLALRFRGSQKLSILPLNSWLVSPIRWGHVCPRGAILQGLLTGTQTENPSYLMAKGIPLHLPPSPVLLLHEVQREDQGTYSCVATHPSHGPQESPAVRVVIEAEEGPIAGSVEGQELGTVALVLGILGGLGIAVLLIGAIMWRRQRRRREKRKASENQEEEEERAELNQPEEPEAAESRAAGP